MGVSVCVRVCVWVPVFAPACLCMCVCGFVCICVCVRAAVCVYPLTFAVLQRGALDQRKRTASSENNRHPANRVPKVVRNAPRGCGDFCAVQGSGREEGGVGRGVKETEGGRGLGAVVC